MTDSFHKPVQLGRSISFYRGGSGLCAESFSCLAESEPRGHASSGGRYRDPNPRDNESRPYEAGLVIRDEASDLVERAGDAVPPEPLA